MPEMQFDLDMIWIRDGSIRGIIEDVPRPQEGQPLATLPRYPSPGEVEMVLEVPAGFAHANGISSGDSVEIVLPE